VIGVARSKEKLEQLKPLLNTPFSLIQADLSQTKEVIKAAQKILKEHDRIDVLINNAATVPGALVVSEEGHEMQFQVNHLAVVTMTHQLLPTLEKSNGLIITTSSDAHKPAKYHKNRIQRLKKYSLMGAYSETKLYNLLFTKAFNRIVDTNIFACAVHPGLVNTDLGGKDTKGIAVNSEIGIEGADISVNPVTKDCNPPNGASTNGTMNVVREPKSLNISASNVGQIGFNSTLYPTTIGGMNNQFAVSNTVAVGDTNYTSNWPFIQLYDFSEGGSVEVAYNKAGAAQTVSLSFDIADDIELNLDRTVYPQSAMVHIEIADFWLNIDPTDEDSWTFDVTSGAEGVQYGVYDENGSAITGTEDDIVSDLNTLMNADGKLTINGAANGQTSVIEFANTDNGAVANTDDITFLETGVNTGIFTSYDSDDDSTVKITAAAARGTTATITYDDEPQSILVGHSFGTISMEIADDEWNSGESLDVTLVDNDLNKNSLVDEDLDVEVVGNTLIPSLVTGDPFTLGEKSSSLRAAFFNATIANADVADGSMSYIAATGNAGNGTGTVTVYDFSQIGKVALTEADETRTGISTQLFKGIVIDLGATMADLKESINTNSTGTFYGFNLLSYNLQSLNTTGTVSIHLVNSTHTIVSATDYDVVDGGPLEQNNLIKLVNDGTPKGLVSIQRAVDAIATNNQDNNSDASQNIGLYIESSAGAPLTENSSTDSIYVDFLTFGFSNSGEDASERTSNQIARFELEETGDNTGEFVGTLEYLMVNQLNVHDITTYTGLVLESDEVTVIAFEDLTDEDALRINFLDLGADGVSTQIADQEEAPSHSGSVSFDNDSYKVADTVTITLEDADLNTNSDLIDVFTTVNTNNVTDSDVVGNYEPKAVGLAEKLLKFKKDIASLTLIPAGGGVFEVMANDQLVYSKVATGEFPDPDQVVREIRKLKDS
jgi:selT/selW/selH-like putative selenoprotein